MEIIDLEKQYMVKYPLVTVNVLTYKNFDYISETLESIFSQKYRNIEILISDDGSQNFDNNYIDSMLQNRPVNIKNIKIIHHIENIGTVKNLNNCLNLASGVYYIGLSSDDLFYNENVIEDVVAIFKETGALMVTTKRLVCTSDMMTEIEILPKENDVKYLEDGQKKLFQRLCYENFISGACTFYSAKLIENYGLWDEAYKLLEDYPRYLLLSRKGEKIYYYDKIAIKYRLGGVSTAKKTNSQLKIDFDKVIQKEILPYIVENRKLFYWKKFDVAKEKSGIELVKFIFGHPKIFIWRCLNRLGIFTAKPDKFL